MVIADSSRVGATWRLLQSWHDEGHCRAVTAETGSDSGEIHSFSAGHLGADDESPVTNDSVFLIASPTKPFVATAAMMLVERGQLQLDHRVKRYLPDFRGHGKAKIRINHLLTHTSGLPDMLPHNLELRQSHAPLSEFMEHVCEVNLVAPAGTTVHYQSMGILTLGTIIEKIVGAPLATFLADEIFRPLEMTSTSLGIPDEWISGDQLDRMTWSQVDDQSAATDWGWNSRYWRGLGAPWGGLLSTSPDLGRFCRHVLQIHGGQEGILAPMTLQAMTTNQLTMMAGLSSDVIRSTPWGFGWQLNWPGHPRGFGSLLPRESYGHWGATGTMIWIDPTRGVYGIVLTTEPIELENRRQIAFGNLSSVIWQR